jgi:CRISPR-associated protein Csy1
MQETIEERSRSATFRAAIATFINERRDAKLKSDPKKFDPAKYDYATWLADAARRVAQIQAVTHVLKATHPDARGSSLHVTPACLPAHDDIGTHVLGDDYEDDIVGNAAALDVYKFLKLEVDGKRLLDWLLEGDADLLAALDVDEASVREWAAAFTGLIRPASALASHEKAKQVYWCVSDKPTNDANFELLQPLFSSALAHAVHERINEARFGEVNTALRQARRDKKAGEGVYQDYRGLVARKLGGTKPQNISQLNSERGGVNYLLASLPPSWNVQMPRRFLGIESALLHFGRYEGVPALVRSPCRFPKSNPEPTMETRIERERIEQALGQSLAAFGLMTQQSFAAGWTREADCQLPLYEKLWLDPERAQLPPRLDHQEEDEAFAKAYERKDWPDEVAGSFAQRLNAILRKSDLPVGDAEYKHWARQAIVETVEWPATMQRRALPAIAPQAEAAHG